MDSRERFLQVVWRHGLFNSSLLETPEGEKIVIHDRGRENSGPGPDFLNARLSIGPVLLAGDVEIHTEGNAWYSHGHHEDPAYAAVVLHVVGENPVITRCGTREIPVAAIGHLISESATAVYSTLLEETAALPCARLLKTRAWPPDRIIIQWHGSSAQRLREKAQRLSILARNARLTDATMAWFALLRALGFGVNAEPFQMLSLRLPWQLLERHSDKPFTITGLVFGMAGLIEKIQSPELRQKLQKEFDFFAPDLDFPPLPIHVWRFGGTRPGNHPHRRLGLFLRWFLHLGPNLSEKFITVQSPAEFKKLLRSHPLPLPLDENIPSGQLSPASLETLIVNSVPPFLAYLSAKYDEARYFEQAVAWLESLPPEQNRLTRLWQGLGYAPSNAFESQGIIELTHSLCRLKGCMRCSIGQALVKTSHPKPPL
ncbi:MAG: DUF2851 family protein [Flavobacteriales bacterium]|nr:DUF2851 family protein [Flavobacteriales bacterium]MDW8433009.1 DUF2851 family protein [Flavobacteriales bacterium]